MIGTSPVVKPRNNRNKLISNKILLLLIVVGGLIFGQGLYMQAKALVAQQLLTFAWARHLQDGLVHKAWPWADSAPFAQLTLPGKEPLIILSGASGSNLAFAPSWMVSSAPLAHGGNSVIVAHNDTHFSHLNDLEIEQQLTLSAYGNSRLFYEVVATKVVQDTDLAVLENGSEELLTLITCYPFDSTIYNSEKRFVVVAKRIKDTRSPITVSMVDQQLHSHHY